MYRWIYVFMSITVWACSGWENPRGNMQEFLKRILFSICLTLSSTCLSPGILLLYPCEADTLLVTTYLSVIWGYTVFHRVISKNWQTLCWKYIEMFSSLIMIRTRRPPNKSTKITHMNVFWSGTCIKKDAMICLVVSLWIMSVLDEFWTIIYIWFTSDW